MIQHSLGNKAFLQCFQRQVSNQWDPMQQVGTITRPLTPKDLTPLSYPLSPGAACSSLLSAWSWCWPPPPPPGSSGCIQSPSPEHSPSPPLCPPDGTPDNRGATKHFRTTEIEWHFFLIAMGTLKMADQSTHYDMLFHLSIHFNDMVRTHQDNTIQHDTTEHLRVTL